jgi:hypothetical protein
VLENEEAELLERKIGKALENLCSVHLERAQLNKGKLLKEISCPSSLRFEVEVLLQIFCEEF